MNMGCNRSLAKPPSVEKKYYLHSLATNIEDGQLLWHLILMCEKPDIQLLNEA
jgi:hypothetical protein